MYSVLQTIRRSVAVSKLFSMFTWIYYSRMREHLWNLRELRCGKVFQASRQLRMYTVSSIEHVSSGEQRSDAVHVQLWL